MQIFSYCLNRLAGQVVKASAPKAVDPSSIPTVGVDIFPSGVMPVTVTLALHWLACRPPAVLGSALGLCNGPRVMPLFVCRLLP